MDRLPSTSTYHTEACWQTQNNHKMDRRQERHTFPSGNATAAEGIIGKLINEPNFPMVPIAAKQGISLFTCKGLTKTHKTLNDKDGSLFRQRPLTTTSMHRLCARTLP
jgi:hypothetical protein